MSKRLERATESAYDRGLEDGRRQKWTELVRAVGQLAGELHASAEAQRVLHLVQERFAALSEPPAAIPLPGSTGNPTQ